MSDYHRDGARGIPADSVDMSVDAGLRSFMLGVYNKMALGLLISAGLAYLTSNVGPIADIFYRTSESGRLLGVTGFGMVLQFAPLAIILVSMFAMRNPSPRSSGILYWSIVSTIGAGAGIWLLLYTGASVFLAFLITAAAFGSLSLFGYTTKKDLSGFGSFLIMGVVGLILAGIVNMFLQLSALSFIINAAGVLIFAGLTAYDTQKLKMTYYALGGDETGMAVATNYGALSLYLDFINIFQFLLHFVGVRRD